MPATCWAWGVVVVTVAGLAVAVMLAPTVSRSSSPVSSTSGALGWLLFMGTSVHVAATGCLFVLPEARSAARGKRRRSWWVPSGVVALAALLSVLVTPSAMALLLLAIFVWQFWHYQKQNLGMVAFAAASHRVAAPTRAERRALGSAAIAGMVGLVANPSVLSLDIHLPPEPLEVLAEVLLVAATAYGLALVATRPPRDRPATFSTIYLLSLLFWIPIFLFRSPYAAVGGMTIAHGFQYLVLVGLVLAGPGPTSYQLVRSGLALSVALLAGALLSWSSHLHGSPLPLRVLFGAYLGMLMSHFYIDGRLWRLRDPLGWAFLAARVPYLLSGAVTPHAGGSADEVKSG